MRNTILILFMLLSLSSFGKNIGFKAGLGISTLTGTADSNLVGENEKSWGYNKNYNIGFFYNVNATESLSVQTEFLISVKESLYESPSNDYSFNVSLEYLEIPLLLKYNTSKNFCVYGGGYFSKLIRSYYNIKGNEINYKYNKTDIMNEFDSGLIGGIIFKYDKLLFDFRYSQGLLNIYKDSKTENFNQVFNVSLGYIFWWLVLNYKIFLIKSFIFPITPSFPASCSIPTLLSLA